MKNQNKIILIIVGILSATIVFAAGKVEAGDGTAASTIQTKAKRFSFIDVDRAQSDSEKRRMLLEMIENDPETEEGWAISENIQIKRDAAYELLSLKPIKEDIQTIVDQIHKEKYTAAKQELMDAISNSLYKDITVPAYKKVAENDDDIFIRGLATHFYIKLGDPNDGFELMKKLFEYMDRNNELAYYYNGVNSFSDPEIKEKVKKFLLGLKDDESKGNVIRSYAAIICQQKYKTDISIYYSMIKETVLKNDIKKSAATYMLSKLKYLSGSEIEANKILNEASRSGNTIVKEIIRNFEKPKK